MPTDDPRQHEELIKTEMVRYGPSSRRNPNKLIYKEYWGAGFDISPVVAIIVFFAILIILSLTGRL